MNESDEVVTLPGAIAENPFRILALPANASEREIQKRIRTLSRYAEVGKEMELDFDFPVLGPVERSLEAIRRAASQIEHSQERLVHALFWFLKQDSVDEVALSHLAKGSKEKARSVWQKVPRTKSVSDRQLSALFNTGTLDLVDAFGHEGEQAQGRFVSAIHGKGALLEPESFLNLSALVAGKVANVDSAEVIKVWAKTIAVEASSSYLASDMGALIDVFKGCPPPVFQQLSEYFVSAPKHKVEAAIRTCEVARESAPTDASTAARTLFSESDEPLQILEQVWGVDSSQYDFVADEVGEELLACGLTYFKAHDHKESDVDPGRDTEVAFDMALQRARGEILRQRIQENQEGLRGWLQGADKRKRWRAVDTQLDFLSNKVEQFDAVWVEVYETGTVPPLGSNEAQTAMAEVSRFLADCLPRLKEIRDAVGETDETYLVISDSVGQSALYVSFFAVQGYMAGVDTPGPSHRRVLESLLQKQTNNLTAVGRMSLDAKTRESVTTHLESNSALQTRLNPPPTSSAGNSGGCFIATMAFGDAEHPDVRALRDFRDNYLLPCRSGQAFVSWYYRHSPSWVSRCKNAAAVRWCVRHVLHFLVGVLPK